MQFYNCFYYYLTQRLQHVFVKDLLMIIKLIFIFISLAFYLRFEIIILQTLLLILDKEKLNKPSPKFKHASFFLNNYLNDLAR